MVLVSYPAPAIYLRVFIWQILFLVVVPPQGEGGVMENPWWAALAAMRDAVIILAIAQWMLSRKEG
jgi:hypothetical protein